MYVCGNRPNQAMGDLCVNVCVKIVAAELGWSKFSAEALEPPEREQQDTALSSAKAHCDTGKPNSYKRDNRPIGVSYIRCNLYLVNLLVVHLWWRMIVHII